MNLKWLFIVVSVTEILRTILHFLLIFIREKYVIEIFIYVTLQIHYNGKKTHLTEIYEIENTILLFSKVLTTLKNYLNIYIPHLQ